MKLFIRLLTTLIFYSYSSALWAGQTTLVTHYPSPSGHYDSIQLTVGMDEQRACIGSNSDGTLFVDDKGAVQVCKGQKSTTGSAWKLSDSALVPGAKVLTPPGVNDVFFNNKVGIGEDPTDISGSAGHDKLTVVGEKNADGIAIKAATPKAAAGESSLSSRIVFYINEQPKMYFGITQDTEANILSFLGPQENATDSFFTIDNTTGNIGIGNNAPAQKLDITGGLKVADKIEIDNDIITGGGIYFSTSPVADTTAGAASITKNADNSIVISSGTSATPETQKVKITNSLEVNGNLKITNGNVGIGLTADPEAILDVNGIVLVKTPTETDPPNSVITKEFLETQAVVNSSACFNRFCSYSNPGTRCSASCPNDYPQLNDNGTDVQDDFITDTYTSGNITYTTHVISIVCCSNQ